MLTWSRGLNILLLDVLCEKMILQDNLASSSQTGLLSFSPLLLPLPRDGVSHSDTPIAASKFFLNPVPISSCPLATPQATQAALSTLGETDPKEETYTGPRNRV